MSDKKFQLKYNIMTNVMLTILIVLTLGLTTPKKETIFNGIVNSDTKNKGNVFGLYIEFRVDTLVIARNIIQQDGIFKISVTTNKEFDIYYCGIGVGDTYIQTIKPTEKDTVWLSFKIPNNHKKHFGKTICPKCNKHDQTISILYGFGSAVIVNGLHYDNKYYYAATCITSGLDPKFFCKRDKIKF